MKYIIGFSSGFERCLIENLKWKSLNVLVKYILETSKIFLTVKYLRVKTHQNFRSSRVCGIFDTMFSFPLLFVFTVLDPINVFLWCQYILHFLFSSIGCCRYGAELAKNLTSSLLSVFVSCGSIRICFSNRTPEKVCHARFSYKLFFSKFIAPYIIWWLVLSSTGLKYYREGTWR